MPLLSSVHISFYENSFKCKLDSNNINNQAFLCHWIQTLTLKSLPVCLQNNKSQWFSNNFHACVLMCGWIGVHVVHLSTYISERLSHSRGWSTRERFDTFKSLYYKQLLSTYFPELHFSGKIIALCFYFLLLSWFPRSRTIASPLAHCFLLFPSLPPSSAELGHARSLPSLPQSTASLLTSLCPFSPLTLHSNRWPTAPAASLLSHDPLTSSCFSCWRRQLSKCLREELLSFSLSPDQFPKWTLWHVLKYSRWWGQIKKREEKKSDILYFDLLPKKRLKREIKVRISLQRKCRIMSGEMFGGKYAPKDASKVNMYEIAQLNWASAAPAKSWTEVERTSKRGELRGEKAETERKNACAWLR